MTAQLWEADLSVVIGFIEILQRLALEDDDDQALHTLFTHWNKILRLIYKQKTGHTFVDEPTTATH